MILNCLRFLLFNVFNFKKITFFFQILHFFQYYSFNWKFNDLFFLYVNSLFLFSFKKSISLKYFKKVITGNFFSKSKFFFKINSLKKAVRLKKTFINFKISFFSKYFYNAQRSFKLFSNTFLLLGQLISPFNWTFENKKIWFRSFMAENFNKKSQNFTSNRNFFCKNIYFNQYDYFSQLKIKFNDFKNFIKITNTGFKLKNEILFLHAKPYTILNNNSFNSSKANPYILVIHNLFKKYLKLDNYFFKIARIAKNKNLENLFIFFSLQKNFFNDHGLIKNWWISKKIKKIRTREVEIFFAPVVFFSLKNDFIKVQKSLKKQLFFAQKFFKNFKFNIYRKISKTNNFRKIKKWAKKYQKNLSYFSFYFSKNKSYIEQKKEVLSRFFSFWNISLISNFHFNDKITKLFYHQKTINFVKHKNKTKKLIGLFKNFFKYDVKINKLFKIYKSPFYSSKYQTSFIGSNVGFLNLTEGFFNYFDIDNCTYNVKKKHYSFLLKNELQKFVIKRFLKTNSVPYSKYFNKIKHEQSFHDTEIVYQNIKKNLLISPKPAYGQYFNPFPSIQTAFFIDQFEVCSNDQTENFSFFIRKIKFKPGYMTFWREARSVFKEVLNLNFKYQKRLTNYILKYNKILKHNLYLNKEMSMRNVLQRSRFFFDWNTSDFFLSQGLFYINGVSCFNYHFQLYVGDLIQMITHLKYYILYRWSAHWILKKKQKLKIKTKRKLTISTSDEDKTRTNRYPTWLLFNKNLSDDTAKFLEIDFFTLSIFIVYEPYAWRDLNLYSHIGNQYSIINMYNWKYIT